LCCAGVWPGDRRARDYRQRFALTDRQAASHEVWIVPYSVCRPRRTAQGKPCPGPFHFGVWRYSGTHTAFASPLWFLAPRASCLEHYFVGNAARLDHSWSALLSATYQIQILSRYRDLAGISLPATLMGLPDPSQLCSSRQVRAPFGVLWPTCRLCRAPAASFIVAGPSQSLDWSRALAGASGIYPCPPAVPCYSPAPL
jgi:hypothetical protein